MRLLWTFLTPYLLLAFLAKPIAFSPDLPQRTDSFEQQAISYCYQWQKYLEYQRQRERQKRT